MTTSKQIEAAFEKWENYQPYYGKQECRAYAKKAHEAGYQAGLTAAMQKMEE